MAAATAAWTGLSSSWSARFIRERLAEWGRDLPPAPHRPVPGNWSDNALTMAWLGHATVLINFFGVRLLTDPVLFPRIGVDLGVGSLGPLRLVQSALSAADLPEIDAILVSHAHFDHLDTPSLAAVPGRPTVIMAPETADLLPHASFGGIRELRWNETVRVATRHGDLQIRAIEVKHWGARLGRDTHRGYNGFVAEREGQRLLVGGDTALTAAFREHRRYGPFAAAIMPIGAYNPWINNHCTPEQAVSMANAAGARHVLPVHHQSFRLSREPVGEPIERIDAALRQEQGRIGWREIGETFAFRS